MDIQDTLKLFSAKNRPNQHIEKVDASYYKYLDCSGTQEANKIRETLNLWFKGYPDGKEKNDLYGKLTSKNNKLFLASFFELYLYTFFKKMGCEVQIHPKLSNNKETRPDFLIKSFNGEDFYLEAKTSIKIECSQIHEAELLKKLDEKLSGMSIGLHISIVSGEIKCSIKIDRQVNELIGWMQNLDRSESVDYRNDEKVIEFGPITLRFRPIKLTDGKRTHAILRWPVKSGFPTSAIAAQLESGIKEKAGKYGKLDSPFILALNIINGSFGFISGCFFDALIGDLIYDFESDQFTRKLNGVWAHSKYRKTALMVTTLDPWSMYDARRDLVIYISRDNPLTSNSVINQLSRVVECPKEGRYQFEQRKKSPADILGLSDRA